MLRSIVTHANAGVESIPATSNPCGGKLSSWQVAFRYGQDVAEVENGGARREVIREHALIYGIRFVLPVVSSKAIGAIPRVAGMQHGARHFP